MTSPHDPTTRDAQRVELYHAPYACGGTASLRLLGHPRSRVEPVSLRETVSRPVHDPKLSAPAHLHRPLGSGRRHRCAVLRGLHVDGAALVVSRRHPADSDRGGHDLAGAALLGRSLMTPDRLELT